MEEMLTRGCRELLDRETGTLHFRLIFQPLMATFFAIRSGLRDAREGRPVFFWAFVLDAPQRRALSKQLWKDIGKLFLVAFALDVIYQVVVLRWFYPVQALIVVIALAVIPYLLIRGLANRFGRGMGWKKSSAVNKGESR